MGNVGDGRIAQDQYACVDQQPAIAIFGKTGQTIDVGDDEARRLQRLDQRIGQPLGELVQRHQAGGEIVRPQRRMVPAIAKGDASELYSGRPDRAQISEQLRQHAR